MEKFRFILFSIVVLALIGLLGFWAVTSIQSGGEHVTAEKIRKLEQENKDLEKEKENLEKELGSLEQEKAPEEQVEPTVPEVEKPVVATTYKYQTLIDELQKLVADGVSMKVKSSGTRVGTVQNFLNIYNKTSNRIDNDYGASTVKAVTAFQKAVGLKANGEAGASTFNKMIDWLKKQ